MATTIVPFLDFQELPTHIVRVIVDKIIESKSNKHIVIFLKMNTFAGTCKEYRDIVDEKYLDFYNKVQESRNGEDIAKNTMERNALMHVP